uniref:Uncharacterized protein n=1 Tax=Ditylenchus dipsaci TaxID=166011 RepID=A0A915DP10_9BILA
MPEYNKFIFTDFMWEGSMYRFASLYGIGKLIQRTPVFLKNEVTVHNLQSEVKSVFPYFSERLIYYQKDYAYLCPSFVHKVKFAADCCEYVDPSMLLNVTTRMLEISSLNLQSYKFFHPYQKEIQRIFKYSALNYLKQAHNNFSLLMIGEDKEFLDTINYPTDIKYVNNFTEMPRAEEMF